MTASALIELRDGSGKSRALINSVGAALSQLSLAGDDALPPLLPEAQADWFAGVTLAPWPNRMANAQWQFEGRLLKGKVNNPPSNAHHGLVFDKRFSVIEQAANSVTLSCLLGEDLVYPFAVRVLVRYELSAQGIRVGMTAVNESHERVPVALGGHPYIAFRDGDALQLDAATVYENDERQIPNGKTSAIETRGMRAGEPAKLSTLRLDDCFTGLGRDPEGLAHARVIRADGSQVDLWQDESFPFTMVYIHRNFFFVDRSLNAVAIEAQTAPANALNSGEALVWLAPNQKWQGTWGIDLISSN